MSEWKSGEFDRKQVSHLFRPFAPAHAVECLESVDLQELWDEGKRLLLVDVDNTLVAWKQENFSPPVLDWIAHAKELGFDICIISNTRRLDRLARIREMLKVETVRGRFKPSRAMFRLALIKFGRKKEEAVMIGDQMMTDILGANRAGIDAIWVQKMDGKEFGPTAINRFVEGMLTSAVYKALVLPEDRTPELDQSAETKSLTLVEQIVRFLIVGGTSFVIDTLLTYLLMQWISIDGRPMGIVFGTWLQTSIPAVFGSASSPDKAAAAILGGLASLVAMFNSFVWNRAWTFEARGRDRKSAQIARFYAISVLGAMLNAVLFSAFYSIVPGNPSRSIVVAKVIAAAIVAVWNFLGQRYFAFRPRQG